MGTLWEVYMEQEISTLHGHLVRGIYGAGDIKPLLGQVCLFYYVLELLGQCVSLLILLIN
jgi:hypothetical protein